MMHDVRFQHTVHPDSDAAQYHWFLYCAKCGAMFFHGNWSIDERREFSKSQGTECLANKQSPTEEE